jgi:ABC-type branched-subunit amino acid transport system substrate-binding protein
LDAVKNSGKPVTIYSVTGIIGKSFSKAFIKQNIEKGFHVTEIYPLSEDEVVSFMTLIDLMVWLQKL